MENLIVRGGRQTKEITLHCWRLYKKVASVLPQAARRSDLQPFLGTFMLLSHFWTSPPLMSIWLCLLLEEKNQWVLSWFYKLSSFLDLWFYNVEQNTGRKKNIHLGLQVIFLPWLIGILVGDINVTGSLGCLQNICQDWQQSFNALPVAFFFFQHVAQTVSDEETDQNWPHLVSPLQTWDMLFISSIFNESLPWEADGTLAIINQSWLQWFCEGTRNWNGRPRFFTHRTVERVQRWLRECTGSRRTESVFARLTLDRLPLVQAKLRILMWRGKKLL